MKNHSLHPSEMKKMNSQLCNDDASLDEDGESRIEILHRFTTRTHFLQTYSKSIFPIFNLNNKTC